MIFGANIGAAELHLSNGETRRFTPTGQASISSRAKTGAREIEDFGDGKTLAARYFVGLNVGKTPTWTPKDVIDIVYKVRKKQGASGDVSVLAQRGIYEDSQNRRIDEKSVQVIVLNLSGDKDFVKKAQALGEELRARLKQERVLIEIQKGGIAQHLWSATDPKVLKREASKSPPAP